MNMRRLVEGLGLAGLLLLGLLLARPALAQQTCVGDTLCDNGEVFKTCNEITGGGSLVRMWYQVGAVVFDCGPNFQCVEAATEAVAYCYSGHGGGGGGTVCATPCGGGCCDDSGGACCNGGCLAEGQTCCGGGLCEAGLQCVNESCIPESATACGDGSFCTEGACCNGGCLYAWETCCGAGVCGQGETCTDGVCLPANGVPCGDGTMCLAGTACAGGQCCPEGFASYDAASGYCCGAGPEAGLCACPVSCGGSCCPEGTVCCGGGFCAPSAEGCPTCPTDRPQFCPDHQCATAGATCCGNGYFCNNSLTCMECDGGGTCCGHKSNPANSSANPFNPGAAQPATTLSPVQAATAGDPPAPPSIDAAAGLAPSAIKRLKGSDDGGCSLGSTPAASAPLGLLLALALAALALRRRA
jgi:hypothetical protein